MLYFVSRCRCEKILVYLTFNLHDILAVQRNKNVALILNNFRKILILCEICLRELIKMHVQCYNFIFIEINTIPLIKNPGKLFFCDDRKIVVLERERL